MTLDELIAALESATGPSRELDEAILKAFCPSATVGEYSGYEEVVFHAAPLVEDKGFLPFFTGSLDAAKTLVADGASLLLEIEPEGRTSCAVLGFKPDGDEWRAGHACIEIAICIAALKEKKARREA